VIDRDADLDGEQRCLKPAVEACNRSLIGGSRESIPRRNLLLPKGRQTIATGLSIQIIEADALAPDLPLLPIFERGDAPSNIYEGRVVIIVPTIRGRLPGELLAGVGEPLFGVPVDLHPSDQRGMVERLRPKRGRDRTLTDEGTKFGRDNAPVVKHPGFWVVSEMTNGLQFVPPFWATKGVPNGRAKII
jgi:hypothetical protein